MFSHLTLDSNLLLVLGARSSLEEAGFGLRCTVSAILRKDCEMPPAPLRLTFRVFLLNLGDVGGGADTDDSGGSGGVAVCTSSCFLQTSGGLLLSASSRTLTASSFRATMKAKKEMHTRKL